MKTYHDLTVDEVISALYKNWHGNPSDSEENEAILAATSLLERVRITVGGGETNVKDAIHAMNDVAHAASKRPQGQL